MRTTPGRADVYLAMASVSRMLAAACSGLDHELLQQRVRFALGHDRVPRRHVLGDVYL
jgi:hypothetical protein